MMFSKDDKLVEQKAIKANRQTNYNLGPQVPHLITINQNVHEITV